MNRRNAIITLSALGANAGLGLSTSARSDDVYPSKQIKLMVNHAAGTILDVWGRRIAERLGQALGQTVLVENKPGAGGTLGAAMLAKSSADGYTIGLTAQAELIIGPLFYQNVGYDTLRDLIPITRLAETSAVLVVSPTLGVRTFRDLVALAKSRPGQLTAASFGNGTVTHLMVLQLRRLTGADIIHVPYKDGAAALNDVVAGHTNMMFNWVTTTKSFVDSGKLIPLLATGTKRLTPFPETLSAAEVGLPDLAISGWAGFTVPANTPRHIVSRLYTELTRVLQHSEVKTAVENAGAVMIAGTSQEFAATIRSQQRSFAELVRVTNAKLE